MKFITDVYTFDYAHLGKLPLNAPAPPVPGLLVAAYIGWNTIEDQRVVKVQGSLGSPAGPWGCLYAFTSNSSGLGIGTDNIVKTGTLPGYASITPIVAGWPGWLRIQCFNAHVGLASMDLIRIYIPFEDLDKTVVGLSSAGARIGKV